MIENLEKGYLQAEEEGEEQSGKFLKRFEFGTCKGPASATIVN